MYLVLSLRQPLQILIKKLKFLNLLLRTLILKKTVTLFTVFELIEHTSSPKKFIKKIYNSLKPNGNLILSFADPEGFELKALGKKSTQFLPPLHLNFMSIAGCTIFLKNIGFKEVQIISRGRLDIDIVKNLVY